ncbi:dimethyladenosine transferase 2, mitochondrial [Sitophilus oryzae]|uniref:Dimethyladenosine transferase 2, mitochondrial n=1 Tax=Sitophilus oryzae TaxID=7048 RepID=A0A6J2XPV2_SITOR|nr:dimethyladenosine transferase 2, mitochondrial [Sitophilus oryzae]
MAILKFIRINKWIPKIRANRCQLCTKSDNEKAPVKRRRHISKRSSEVDAFFQSNNHMEYLKELIPANIKLQRKTVIPDRMYLICPNTAKKVAEYVWEQTKSNTNQLICETNPGVGVITIELLEKGARKVRLYEPNELFHEPLKVLLQKYLHRIEIVDKDLMHLGKYVYLDNKDPADRVEKLLEGIPKKSWTDDPVMTVVGVLTRNDFIKDLVKSIVSRRNITALGRTDFYMFVFPTDWIKLTEEDDVNFYLKFWVILYNIFFDFQLIDKFDKVLFMPWITQTKKNKQPLDPDKLYFIKISMKKSFSISMEDILPFFVFLKCFLRYKNHYIIPTLESWVPDCGKTIIAPRQEHEGYFEDMGIYTKFSELNAKQVIAIFREVLSHPNYTNSPFMETIESETMKFDSIELDMDEFLAKTELEITSADSTDPDKETEVKTS